MPKVVKITTSGYEILRTPQKRETNALRLYCRKNSLPYTCTDTHEIVQAGIRYRVIEPGRICISSAVVFCPAKAEISYSNFPEMFAKARNIIDALIKAQQEKEYRQQTKVVPKPVSDKIHPQLKRKMEMEEEKWKCEDSPAIIRRQMIEAYEAFMRGSPRILRPSIQQRLDREARH